MGASLNLPPELITRLGLLSFGVIGAVLMIAFDSQLISAASNVSATNRLFKALALGVPVLGLLSTTGGAAIAYVRSQKLWQALRTAVVLCLVADVVLFLMVLGLGTAGV